MYDRQDTIFPPLTRHRNIHSALAVFPVARLRPVYVPKLKTSSPC